MISYDEFSIPSEEFIFSPRSKTLASLLTLRMGICFGPYEAPTPRIWKVSHNKWIV